MSTNLKCPIPILLAVLTGMALSACQEAGYGLKAGYQRKMVLHSGYGFDDIFYATEKALKEVGVVTRVDRGAGVIEGELPPYRVKAIIERQSPWEKLEAFENEYGAWQRDETKEEWFISIDGNLYYRVGATDLQDALRKWSRAISKRIPAK